jgi:O-antigen/teichoic acid export membrane protein
MNHRTKRLKSAAYRFLRWSEKYIKADMVYIASGNFWLSSGRIISILSGMVLTVAFANLLSPETFGTYKYILSVASFVGAFSLGGLGAAVTRAVAQGKAHVVPRVARIAFLWSLPASFIAFCGSLYYFINGNVILGAGFLLIALTNPFFNVFVFSKSIPLGKKDFKGMTLVSIPMTVIPVAILAVTLFLTKEVTIILLVYFLSNFVSGLFSYEWFLRKYHISKGNDEGVAEVVTYGKHLSVMGVALQATGNIDQLLLWHFAGPVPVAIYSFALAPIREIRNFSENIFPLIFPKYVNKTIAEMKETVPLRIVQLFIVSLVIGIIYILVAPWLYTIILPRYVSAIFASQLLAAALIFQPKGIVDTMLHAQGNAPARYVYTLTSSGIKLVLSFILIPLYGLMGAVIGVVLTDAFSAFVLWRIYKKLT